MNKSKTAGTHFNVRVVECRTAAQVRSSNKLPTKLNRI